jgi:hypothetical protein
MPTILASVATLSALLISLMLYFWTSALSATTSEDTDTALVLLGRQQLGEHPQILAVPWAGERGFRAAEHISRGLLLAERADSFPVTSTQYVALQLQAVKQYDSALADPVYLGQWNVLLAKSHRWWARHKLGGLERQASHVKLPWYIWALFILGPSACIANIVLCLLRPREREVTRDQQANASDGHLLDSGGNPCGSPTPAAAELRGNVNEVNLRLEYSQLSESARAWVDMLYKAALVYLAIQGFGIKLLFDAPMHSRLSIGLLIFLSTMDALAVYVTWHSWRFGSVMFARLGCLTEALSMGEDVIRSVRPRVTGFFVILVIAEVVLSAATITVFFVVPSGR